jgi:hypothetical protein
MPHIRLTQKGALIFQNGDISGREAEIEFDGLACPPCRSPKALGSSGLLNASSRRLEVDGERVGEKASMSDLVVGGLWLGCGLIISAVSLAVAGSGGASHFVIATGPIAYGLWRMLRGLRSPSPE